MAPPRAAQCQAPVRGARLERAIRRLVGAGGERALEILWRIAQGYPVTPPELAQPGALDLERLPAPALQVRCAQWLLERAFGRAPERVEVSGMERPADLSRLSEAELRHLEAARAILDRATPPDVEH